MWPVDGIPSVGYRAVREQGNHDRWFRERFLWIVQPNKDYLPGMVCHGFACHSTPPVAGMIVAGDASTLHALSN